MRIRKRAKFSARSSISPSPIAGDTADTRVCLLNRSPWDVIAFTPQSEKQHQIQVTMEDNSVKRKSIYTSNRNFTSTGVQYLNEMTNKEQAAEERLLSVHVVKEKAKKKAHGNVVYDYTHNKEVKQWESVYEEDQKTKKTPYIRCSKSDGKGWRCKGEAKQREVLCEHHLVQLEYYHHKYSSRSTQVKSPVMKAAKKRVNRGKVLAFPVEIYLYSGFGPARGRKRGEIKMEERELVDAIDQASSSSLVHVVDDFEYEDEDSNEDNGGQKRFRRPIKARSLKSFL